MQMHENMDAMACQIPKLSTSAEMMEIGTKDQAAMLQVALQTSFHSAACRNGFQCRPSLPAQIRCFSVALKACHLEVML